MKRTLSLIIVALGLLFAAPAMAQNEVSSGPVYEDGGMFGTGIVVALKAGGAFGQPFNETGTGLVGELELGWIVLPFPDLQLFTNLQYQNSTQSGEGTDPQLASQTWSYEVATQQFIITPGLLYRLPFGPDWYRAYVGAGFRIHLTSSEATGESGGEAFGTYTEEATDYGGYGVLGSDFFVGPGSILVELQFGYGSVDHYVLQDTNNGTLNLAVGYRMFF